MLLVMGVCDRCVCMVDLVVVIFVLCVCGRCCIIIWLLLVKNYILCGWMLYRFLVMIGMCLVCRYWCMNFVLWVLIGLLVKFLSMFVLLNILVFRCLWCVLCLSRLLISSFIV